MFTKSYLHTMNPGIKRSTLRILHLVLSIPILGCIYGEPSEVQHYVGAVRLVFVPLILLSGFWMYTGAAFAIIGVVVWIGAIHLSGYGAALLSQVALFIGRKTWLVIRVRQKLVGSK